MEKMGLNNKSYNAKYAKLLSFTLGNYMEMLDPNFRRYVIGETISLFRKEDGLTDLGMLEKDFLSKDDISEEIKREILDGVFRTDEEYEQYISTMEWFIIGKTSDSREVVIPNNKVSMYDYTIEDLDGMYQNREVAEYIFQEISFCKSLQTLRPKNKAMMLEKKEQ